MGGASSLSAQVTVRDSLLADSLRAAGDTAAAESILIPLDTAVASQLGLPTAPSRSFPSSDSIIRALEGREGYQQTRYAADSLVFFAQTRAITLVGSTLLEREGMTLEADSVEFLQAACSLNATGNPKIFEAGTVLIGEDMSYDTCKRQGLVRDHVAESLPGDVGHGQEVDTIFLLQAVKRDDSRVVKRCGRLGLTLESGKEISLCSQPRRQDLERHSTAELGVLGKIDLTHATATELTQETIMTEAPLHLRLMIAASVSRRTPCSSHEPCHGPFWLRRN